VSLLDEAKEASKIKRGCSVSTLDPKLRAEVEEALSADGVTATGVEKALAKRGANVKALTLRRHAQGRCTCEPG